MYRDNTIPQHPFDGAGKQIESLTRKALFDFDLLENAPRIAIALSGGKDSLSLLFLLHAISGRGFHPFTIHPIHISGEFSCGAGVDVPHLEKTCEALGLTLTIQHSTQTRENLECYSCSRERRTLLFNAAKELGATHIAFGHHRDDNAQTLLMNLLQKGEFAGLLPKVPMQRYDITIIRPLIYVSEAQIQTFARQQGFARIVCQCPVGQNSKRKQVDTLIDDMTELFPHARSNLARSSLLYGSTKALQP